MAKNRDNFLRWTGVQTPSPYTITIGSQTLTFYANQDSITFNPLDVMSASLGLNSYSLVVFQIVDLFLNPVAFVREPYWDGVSNLTIYRPVDITITQLICAFSIRDTAGNLSDGATAEDTFIDMSPILTSWIAYAPSAYCTLDSSGNNNGYLAWDELVLINTGTGLPLAPLTLKPNVLSDADYIAPITDYVTCPTIGGTGEYAPLSISNFTQNGSDANPNDTITITQVTLTCSACGVGGAAVTINIPCSISPGQTQRFNVPAGVTWTFTLLYDVTPGGNMDAATPPRYWWSQASGAVDNYPTGSPNQVINAGIMGSNPLLVPYPLGLTIFAK